MGNLLLLLGCASTPTDPCSTLGIWDMDTDSSFSSIESAVESGASEICLGPGTYSLGCGPILGPAFSLVGSGSEVTEVRRPECPEPLVLDRLGGYRFQDLALSTTDIQFSSDDGTELVNVVIRDAIATGHSLLIFGPIGIDGLEIRDSDLSNGGYTFYGEGWVRDLWVHDNQLTGRDVHVQHRLHSLESARIEDNYAGADVPNATLAFTLVDAHGTDLDIVENPAPVVLLLETQSSIEGARIDPPSALLPSVYLFGDAVSEVLSTHLGLGYLQLSAGSTLIARDLEFADGQSCPVRCQSECLNTEGTLTCP
jgi:hypothetical protein